MSEYAFEAAKRGSASIAWSFAAQTLAVDTSTPFSSTIALAYQSTIVAAFARWASVSGLVFTQVADAASVPIRIGFGTLAFNDELGETDYRYSRGVLFDDTQIRLLDPVIAPILSDTAGQFTYLQYGVTLFQVALHEIGHALGLDHTTDPATIMFPYVTTATDDLAAGDIEGINTLYPYYTVTLSNPTQTEGPLGQVDDYTFAVTRYSDPAVPLTIGYSVSGTASPSLAGSAAATAAEFVGGTFPAGQIDFAAGAITALVRIEVAGNAVRQPDQGFTLNLSSLNPTDSVTVRGTVSAMILDDDENTQVSAALLGVYRFFDTANGTHFYSTSEVERNALILTRTDLTYEGLGLQSVGSPSTDPAATAIYRFFDMTSGTHFYSASTAERDVITATRPDLKLEGTAFYEHATAQTGDTPVYRFFDLADGTHFYTSSAAERASIISSRADLREEGIGFYAPAQSINF